MIALLTVFWLPPSTAIPLVNSPKFGTLHKRLEFGTLDKRLEAISDLLDQGLYDDCISGASALIDKNCHDQSTLGYAFCVRGIAKADLNRCSEAIADIDRGLKINPRAAGKEFLYGVRATSLFKPGRNEEALASINQSLAIAPSGTAFCQRGMIFSQMNNYALALRDFNRPWSTLIARVTRVKGETLPHRDSVQRNVISL